MKPLLVLPDATNWKAMQRLSQSMNTHLLRARHLRRTLVRHRNRYSARWLAFPLLFRRRKAATTWTRPWSWAANRDAASSWTGGCSLRCFHILKRPPENDNCFYWNYNFRFVILNSVVGGVVNLYMKSNVFRDKTFCKSHSGLTFRTQKVLLSKLKTKFQNESYMVKWLQNGFII